MFGIRACSSKTKARLSFEQNTAVWPTQWGQCLVCKSLLLQDCLQLSIQLWLSTFSSMLWGCFQAGNTEVRGQEYSPCPPSRNSVMIAALQGDQGLVRLIWISVGDIMWFSCIFPNRSSQDLTLSCGMLNTCPVEREWDLRMSFMSAQTVIMHIHFQGHWDINVDWMKDDVDGAYRAHEQWWKLKEGRRLRLQSSSSWGRTWCQHLPCQVCHRWRRRRGPGWKKTLAWLHLKQWQLKAKSNMGLHPSFLLTKVWITMVLKASQAKFVSLWHRDTKRVTIFVFIYRFSHFWVVGTIYKFTADILTPFSLS